MNYYNEFDVKAAAWLRELMRENLIPEGQVDERSIADVRASDLDGFEQCHFFAGISGWPLALQLAGWPVDRPVWTGSCPCQPFSAAGKQRGTTDERHLWPAWFRLIRECRPGVVIGEQVEGAVGHGWLDGVSADMEGEGYAIGAAVLGAHSVRAPHIRQRLYWVADLRSEGLRVGEAHGLGADALAEPIARRDVGGVGDTHEQGCQGESLGLMEPGREGHWSDFDILQCLDGKSRRVESGTFPLVARLPGVVVPSGDPSVSEAQATAEGRVMRLKGYGNSIVPQVAAQFIKAFISV